MDLINAAVLMMGYGKLTYKNNDILNKIIEELIIKHD
jgi:hypothetical protein